MKQKFRIRLFVAICILILLIFLIPCTWSKLGQVYAINEGETIEIPTTFEQYGATYEQEDIQWDEGTNQKKVFEVWASQNKPIDENNWAYITVANQKRYLVALATTFGLPGDYVDIYVKNGNTETVYPCLIGDAKGLDEKNAINDGAFIYNGIHYGHASGDICNVLEIILKDYSSTPSGEFLASLTPVSKIQNGGSYFDHPDGPVGLNGGYGSGSATVIDSFFGLLGSLFRLLWEVLATSFENMMTGRSDSTVLYNFYEGNNNINNNTQYSSDVLQTCKDLADYLSGKDAHYGVKTHGNIERSYNDPDHDVVCATYVSMVLWKSGLLTTEQVNSYNYHYTADLPNMLQAAGWHQVPASQAKPGDAVIYDPGPNGHALIYAGDKKFWDESSGVWTRHGAPSKTYRESDFYYNSPLSQFWTPI